MPPKTNKQREKLEQSLASSRAKAAETLRGGAGGFVGFASFASDASAAAPSNPFAAFGGRAERRGGGGSGAADDGSFGSSSASSSAIYDGADHEIAMALKMLGKKGTVTKMKALAAFQTELVPHKKPLELRAMLGAFVQLYTFELRDQKDRKVRHQLNEVLLALATKLKPKAFAPHLRRLLPYWLMAMHDVNGEAAAAASKALEALFPANPEMQAEIVVAHAGAVMEEYSAFFQHTPESFPGVALAESDEREERYERCVAAAVLSVDKIVTLLAATGHVDQLSGADKPFSVASVVSADKFGRLVAASSKNANFTRDAIRKATYKTLKSLVALAYPVVQQREEYFGKLILGALSDKHPANQHDLWDMVLTFLQAAAPTLWRSADAQGFAKFIKSAVQPRLFAQVRHGFYGSARSSFPVLLPLLALVPLDHVVDAASGTCVLYSGVVENAWKFLASPDARFYEDVVIQSAFECTRASMDYFLRSPTNRDAAARLFGTGHDDASCPVNEAMVSAYVGQFEKPTKDSLLALLTSSKFSVRHVKTFATEWQTTVAKLGAASADPISAAVAAAYVTACNAWLLAVLETLPANASVQPSHVNAFLAVVADSIMSDAAIGSCGQRMYESCLAQLQHEGRASLALELMNALYEIVGADALGLLDRGDETVEHHFETHIRPLVVSAGLTAQEKLTASSVATVLRATRQFLALVEDKKAFVLQLFQDFGVQYGDLLKAALVVETCFRAPLTSAGVQQWLASGSFHTSATTPSGGDEAAHALSAVWKGKLLDEFVMISVKGRLDDVDADAFSSLLRSCLGGEDGMPVVSPDVVVILSHFVTQQQADADVAMRLLPGLVGLFTRLGGEPLPSELQAAEEQLYASLFHIAATSNFKTDAEALWKQNVRAAVAKWTDARRLSLVNALAETINGVFASDASGGATRTTTTTYSSKIWASYVELYLELATTGDCDTADDGASSPFALTNRLSVFDLRFEGSRTQLTRMYDRLLSCLGELCEAPQESAAAARIAGFLATLLERERDRGLKLLHRLVDIDVCHSLTWAILQAESMAVVSRESRVAPLDYLSLRPLYAGLAHHLPSLIASIATREQDGAGSSRYRKVLFTNQHTEPLALPDAVDELDDLSPAQHARLDALVVGVLLSFVVPRAAVEYATQWVDQQRATPSPVPIDAVAASLLLLRSEDDDAASVVASVVERMLAKSASVLPQWPGPMGAQALQVYTAAWTHAPSVARTAHAHVFDPAVHHPLLLKMSRAFATASQSSVDEWLAASAYLVAAPSAWAVEAETLEDTKKRWSLAARGLLTHALAGNADAAEVATLRIAKRTLPASLGDGDGDGDGDDDEKLVTAFSTDVVRSRGAAARLAQAMASVDGGEPLRELASEHREALLSTLLVGLAEGLLLKSHLVSVYLALESASASLAAIELAAEIDAMLDAATLALPALLAAFAGETDRVRALLLDAFVHVKGLAACFNSDKSTTPVRVRGLLYAVCTHTRVFQPTSATAGIDLDAADEAATEAALAKSIIPAGLRAALKAVFQSSSPAASSSSSTAAAASARRRKPRQQRPEDDDAVVGRLLVWDLFIQLFPDSGSRDGGHLGMRSSALCAYVARNGLLSSYLTLCGELLSREAGAHSLVARLKLQDAPLLSLDRGGDADAAVGLAARSFFRTVLRLPAMVRTWWNDECSRSLRSWATKYFEEHITPYVLTSELEIIQRASEKRAWDVEEMSVKGSKVSREITTTYVKDECALEMVIRVPASYPLRSVEVECTRRIGITEDRWRRWVLQIIKVTSAQDGSLLDAVLLWKQNVDKEFEGVEPCPICYSILNPKTMGLPNLSCKTCANKYHNSCLYKWFNQSGKNKCPICQQPFT